MQKQFFTRRYYFSNPKYINFNRFIIQHKMGTTTYLVVIIFLGSLVNSTFGFGFALTTVPLLSLFLGLNTLGPLIPLLFLTSGILIVFQGRKNVQFKSVIPLALAATLIIPIGVYLNKYGPEMIMKLILGIFIVIFSIYNLKTPVLPKLNDNKTAPIFGGLSGLFAGICNISGPPAVIYAALRQWQPNIFRVTLQAYFLYVNCIVISSHVYIRSYDNPNIVLYYLIALPSMLLAIPIGKKINQSIKSPQKFNKYVYGLMLFSGVLLIVKSINTIL
ncbi:sulfite exporter TauE/SafE family protein [Aureispira sp. CCB-QB1]|uniref:sulfite exporter TauE/SafE family protein n=1 Tax=Aureispira sp. CCB-QB1 TaxID=1313421 RepID=UPI0012DD6CDA|nr:sulfite exporter TauE/SafE family protein [Aureispira sp. CCB-QB1]